MKPGEVIKQRYTVEALAGHGSTGSVYKARDSNGQTVALKVLGLEQQQLEERFVREAQMLMTLRHPGIVGCLDMDTTATGERFLVLEWLEGIDLRARLYQEPLALDQALALIARLADALAVAGAHGVVHRDIKPANIFLPGGQAQEAKLLDFGVAHWASAAGLTTTGMQLGTPAYMAPEQIRGERRIDIRADLFSLGCVLYECLSGEAAFQGHHPVAVFYKILMEEAPRISRVVRGVPEPVVALLARMLAKDPAARPQDGAALAAEVRRIQAEAPRTVLQPRRALTVTGEDALTTTERHLVSVVLVAAPDTVHTARDAPTINDREARAAGERAPTMEDIAEAAILQLAPMQSLRQRYMPLGVRFDYLNDGSLIAALDTRSTAAVRAHDAARCALDLRALFPGRTLAVATGHVVVGQPRLLGEVIDRATALIIEAGPAAEPGILLDPMSARLIGARFHIERTPRGPLLVAEKRVTQEPMVLGRPTPFVGRRSEMASLAATLDECIEEHISRAVLVTGPPGLGKSRLRRELLRHIGERDQDIEVWQVSGDPMRTGSPLDLFGRAIRRIAGIREGEPLSVRQDKLAARVQRALPRVHAARVTAFLGELVKTPWPDEDDPQLRAARRDSRLMADQIGRACQDFLAAEARARPVVLVIEDLHWGDRATIALLDVALRNLAKLPFLLVAFARPELHELLARAWSARNVLDLRLRPLSERVAETLVRAVLGDALDADRVAWLVKRADGNALYLEELIRSAAAGRWEMPETVLAMVQARLQALAPAPRHVLRAASIFGERFWRGGLDALLGADIDVDGALQTLIEEEIVVEASAAKFADEAEYGFRHELMREAAYGMLTEDDRRLGHRLAGRWLEAAGEASALVMAEHFERADTPEEALPFLIRAAERACKAADLEAAIALAERGVRCRPQGEVLGALRGVQAEALRWQGKLADTVRYGSEAMALLPRGSRAWYEAVYALLSAHAKLGEVDKVEELAAVVQRDRPADHDRHGWLGLAAILSFNLYLYGRVTAASRLLERARLELGEVDAPAPGTDPAVAALIIRAGGVHAAIVDGNPGNYLRALQQATARWEQVGDLRRVCDAQVHIGFAQIMLGRYHDAEATLRAALAIAEQMKIGEMEDTAKQNLSLPLAYQGARHEARELARTSAESFEQRGNQRMAALSRLYLATILLLDGELADAEGEAHTALAMSPAGTSVHCESQINLARIVLVRGRTDEALELATKAMESMQALGGLEDHEALVYLVHAEALHAGGRTEQARAAIMAARDRLLARADKLDRPDWRQSFLENIPDHARTLELARRWQ